MLYKESLLNEISMIHQSTIYGDLTVFHEKKECILNLKMEDIIREEENMFIKCFITIWEKNERKIQNHFKGELSPNEIHISIQL
jgi:hypothetical protein